MKCSNCNAELTEGALFCSQCGRAVGSAPPASPGGRPTDSLEQIIHEASRAAKEAAVTAARFSKKAFEKADVAMQHPGTTAKSVARRAIKELDEARKDLEKVIDDLK
jgi:zinc ribbon protein